LKAKHDYYDTQDGYVGFKGPTGVVMSKAYSRPESG
jgi:hypothetical protein